MANSFKEAFRLAGFNSDNLDRGASSAKEATGTNIGAASRQAVASPARGGNPTKPGLTPPAGAPSNRSGVAAVRRTSQASAQTKAPAKGIGATPQKTKSIASSRHPPSRPPREYDIQVLGEPSCTIREHQGSARKLLTDVEGAGRAVQVHTGETSDDREVVLGLDFGTSCAKVVIGDYVLNKAWAVPFYKPSDIESYLIPSRLFQTGQQYSLSTGTHEFRDLKLALMADPGALAVQQRVVAFLALVIRRARGWFLNEHRAPFVRTNILWKLSIGLPAALHQRPELSRLFAGLANAAWTVAGLPEDVQETSVRSALDENRAGPATTSDVEVTVVPEIAAQIYGFVVSNQFDRNAANIFLMADVGSGTVDSSLFHVRSGLGGRYDFEFFTSVVEANGVSNLHRHRVDWWIKALTQMGGQQRLVDEVARTKLFTDIGLSIPETFRSYFIGLRPRFMKNSQDPDEYFFKSRVSSQVRGRSLWRAWMEGLLKKDVLAGVPFFMCGGGARMDFYRQLNNALTPQPGFPWLRAVSKTMSVPRDLIAPGVAPLDYDRLSVAYGLSRLEVGKVVRALPMPKLPPDPTSNWRDHYVDKDLC